MRGGRSMNPKRALKDATRLPSGRARAARGLTLLEILLALIVMVLGIVGILALFPPALESSKDSMEYSQAAITGESVANALAVALRLATYDPGSGQWTAVLTHDLETSGSTVRYTFALPKLSDGLTKTRDGTRWIHHPPGVAANDDPEAQLAFALGADPWTKEQLKNVKLSDPNDPLNQFAFSFQVRKVHTLAYLEGTTKPDGRPYTLDDLDPLSKLYEFRIIIFRVQGTVEGGSEKQNKRAIAVLTTRISTK